MRFNTIFFVIWQWLTFWAHAIVLEALYAILLHSNSEVKRSKVD